MLSIACVEVASLAPNFIGPISWPTLQANAISASAPDSSAGTTPTDPANPTPTDPANPTPTDPAQGLPPLPGVPPSIGDVIIVNVFVKNFTNSTKNDIKWTPKFTVANEVAYAGNLNLTGVTFNGGISGSYKNTDTDEDGFEVTVKPGETISVIVHYTLTYQKDPGSGWGLKTFSQKSGWVGRFTGWEFMDGNPANMAPSGSSGSPKPTP